jgi:effector-binding domain-containing protein
VTSSVSLGTVQPRLLAAVRRRVALCDLASVWRPALDEVWKFLRAHPGLRDDGHNIFLYHRPPRRDDPIEIDFGVEVTRSFAAVGEVHATETPAGEVAMAVHRGAYERLPETHDAVQHWVRTQNRSFGGHSWEIYGDWSDDVARLETTVLYLLR